MLYPDTVILVFAKAPIEGEVNTRLIDDIGVRAATRLQHDLINHRLTALRDAQLCDVWLMCAPDSQHEKFLLYKKRYPVTLFSQSGEHLGDRMANGISEALEQYDYCVVIGTDAPALDIDMIKQAIDVLRAGSEVVIVPAEDGGYVLIAMQQECADLFEGICWGSVDVMQQTRERLIARGLSYRELGVCWDIDRVEDYERYLAMLKDKLYR
jgi:uncharacterized protein